MLTLPPYVGARYLYRNKDSDELQECEIIAEHQSTVYTGKKTWIYKSRSKYDSWTFWPDGKAKTGSGKDNYCAELVEDVNEALAPSAELKKLQNQREAMMQKLKEIGAC